MRVISSVIRVYHCGKAIRIPVASQKSDSFVGINHRVFVRFFACLAGLTPLDGGWKRFAVQPCFPEKLLSASAGVPTPYGEAALRWVHRYGSRYVYLQVPFGTTAVVTLPGLGTFEAGSGFHHWELPE